MFDLEEEDDGNDRAVTRGRPELDSDTVIGKFSNHFVPKRNIIYERACFHKRVLKSGESVEAFVRSLFGPTKEEEIRDRIVIGISDDVSQKLQLEPKLALDRAIQIASQNEQIKQQNDESTLRAYCRCHGAQKAAVPGKEEQQR